MWVLVGIIALIVFTVVRPHEFVSALVGAPMLHVATAFALLGLAADFASGRTKPRANPVTPWALTLLAWAALTLLKASPSTFTESIVTLFTAVVLCLCIVHGVQTPRAFTILTVAVLACAVWLLGVGLHQGLAPFQCMVEDESLAAGLRPVGTPCETLGDCYDGPRDGDDSFRCERAGLFGTTSVGEGRIRYLGILQDPNELALTLGAALPLAYALRRERRSTSTTLLALAATALVIVAIIMTRSRGGQLVLVTVMGCYFVAQTGLRGAIVGVLAALPVVIYGGRTSASASSSSEERIEAWYVAFELVRDYPITGVGYLQFVDHHTLTAHNAYVLALAELGFIGLFVFVGVLYTCAKILLAALRFYRPADVVPRAWAIALLAALSGIAAGIFFLSFAYHVVLWTFIGLCGAFYGVARRADERFAIQVTLRDHARIFAITLGLAVMLFLFTRAQA